MRGLKPGLFVFLLSAGLILPWLGRQDFYTRGEPREALLIQNMLLSGNWILPQGYSEVVPSKPPLMHWIGALFSLVQNQVTEYSARLPSALASIVFLIFFYFFLHKRLGPKQGLAACLILLTSIEWFRCSIVCRVDMLFSALLCAGLLTLYGWFEKSCAGWPLVPAVLLALATLSKGPVAILLPAIVFAVFLLSQKHAVGRSVISLLKVFLPALLVASLWYVLAYNQRPEAFANKVYYENVARFLSSQEDEPHEHSVFYLLGTLVLGFMPWSVLALAVFVAKLRRMRAFTWQVVKDWLKEQTVLSRYALIGVLCFVVFFAIPSGKRSVYLLPVYPFISIFLAELLLDDLWQRTFRWGLGLLAALVVVLYAVAALNLAGILRPEMLTANSRSLQDLFFLISTIRARLRSAHFWELLLLVLPLLLALAALVASFKAGSLAGSWVLAVALFSSVILAGNAVVLAWVGRALSPRQFAVELGSLLPRDERLYSFGDEFYGLSFYLKRQVYRLEEHPVKNGLVFMNLAKFSELRSSLPPSFQAEIMMPSPNPVTKPRTLVALLRLKS